MKIKQVISGGQTGADIAGLRAAKRVGIPTGGTAPKGWETEDGPKPDRLRSFGLIECTVEGYPARTKANVHTADITLIFSGAEEKGTRLTKKLCLKANKHCLLASPNDGDTAGILEILNFIRNRMGSREEFIVNVAGNRASKSEGIEEKVEEILVKVFEAINGRKAHATGPRAEGSHKARRNPKLFKH
jgi:hypothetical protein